MPQPHARIPRAHGQVSFMELALDFEAFAGRPLPPAPQSKFVGGDMSLQEKGRALRCITLVGRATERQSIFPAKMTHHCRSLTSMGAGTVMGPEGRPIFTKPLAVWKHLERLRTYGEARCAQKQKARTTRRHAKTKGPAKKQAAKPPGGTTDPEWKRCPAKGGANSALRHCATDFHAKPEKVPAGLRAGGRHWGRRGKWEAGGAGSTHLHATGNPKWGQKKGTPEAADQVLGL